MFRHLAFYHPFYPFTSQHSLSCSLVCPTDLQLITMNPRVSQAQAVSASGFAICPIPRTTATTRTCHLNYQPSARVGKSVRSCEARPNGKGWLIPPVIVWHHLAELLLERLSTRTYHQHSQILLDARGALESLLFLPPLLPLNAPVHQLILMKSQRQDQNTEVQYRSLLLLPLPIFSHSHLHLGAQSPLHLLAQIQPHHLAVAFAPEVR